MQDVKSFFKKVRIDNIVRAILLIVMGVLFFIDPQGAMVSAAMVFSIFILVDGICSLVEYFMTAGLSSLLGGTLVGSLFKILFGLVCLCNLGGTTTFFSYLFAFYVIISGINSIEQSMYLKRVNNSYWLIDTILGCLTLVGGILMLFLSPFDMVYVAGIITGVTLIIAAINEIVIVIQMYKAKKEVKSVVKEFKDVIDVTPEDK